MQAIPLTYLWYNGAISKWNFSVSKSKNKVLKCLFLKPKSFLGIVVDNQFVKKIFCKENEIRIFHKFNSNSRRIIVRAERDIFLITSPIKNFSLKTYNELEVEKLVFKLIAKVNKTKRKIISYHLSYALNEHYIDVFGLKTLLIWKTHLRKTFYGDYDAKENKLIIYCHFLDANNSEKRKKIFINVLKTILEKYLKIKQEKLANKLKVINVPFTIQLKKTAWGTNHRNFLKISSIKYDVKLVALEKKYIDYVIAHELVHLIHHNHSQQFYNYGQFYFSDFMQLDKEMKNIKVDFTDEEF